jgi:hypothetical protein
MSGGASSESGAPHAGVTWRDYVDMRIKALEEITSRDRETLNVRLAGMNEIRAAMAAQAEKYATSENVASLRIDVESLRLSRASLEGKASQADLIRVQQYAAIGAVVGVAGLILAIVSILLGVFL